MPKRDRVEDILAVKPARPDRFTGSLGAHNPIGSSFGGRQQAQAMLSAKQTDEPLPVSSLNA